MNKRLPVVGIIWLILSGCSHQQTRPVPEMSSPQQWGNLSGQIVKTSTDAATSQVPWWLALNDPLLNQLIDEALSANPDVLSAISTVREARAYRIQSKGSMFPTVTAKGSVGRSDVNRTETRSETDSLGLEIAWEPDVFGRQAQTLNAAEAQLLASKADYADVAISLSAEVAKNYVLLRNYQAQLQQTQASLKSWQETRQLTEWQAQSGIVSQLDVEQARRSYEQTRATLPEFEYNIAQTQHQLALLLGRMPEKLPVGIQQAAPLPISPAEVLMPLPVDVLRQRPDVRAAEQRVVAAMAKTDVAQANRKPNFALVGTLGFSAANLTDLFSIDSLVKTLTASVSQTLFDNGQLKAQVDIQREQELQAIYAYQKTVLTALQETENALVAVQRNREVLAALEQALQASAAEESLSVFQYKSGQIAFSEVLTAQRTQLALRQQYATAQMNELTQVITLTKAVMGGWAWQRVEALPQTTPETQMTLDAQDKGATP